MEFISLPLVYEPTSSDGRPMGEGRSVGVHLSDIIKFMRVRGMGEKLDGKGNQDLMTMGFIFEKTIETAMRDYFAMQRPIVIPQNETLLDGIYMTPDATNVEDGYQEEYKFTKKTLKKALEKEDFERHFWFWLVQVASACHAMGTDLARIIACFVMGDWSWKPPNGDTAFRCFDLRFEPWELTNNWDLVKQARDEMLDAEEEGTWTR